jgi:hypothetical protein
MSEILSSVPTTESQPRFFHTIFKGSGYPLTLIGEKLVFDQRVCCDKPVSLCAQLYTGTVLVPDLFTGKLIQAITTDIGSFRPQGVIRFMPGSTMFTTGNGQIHHLPQSL